MCVREQWVSARWLWERDRDRDRDRQRERERRKKEGAEGEGEEEERGREGVRERESERARERESERAREREMAYIVFFSLSQSARRLNDSRGSVGCKQGAWSALGFGQCLTVLLEVILLNY